MLVLFILLLCCFLALPSPFLSSEEITSNWHLVKKSIAVSKLLSACLALLMVPITLYDYIYFLLGPSCGFQRSWIGDECLHIPYLKLFSKGL